MERAARPLSHLGRYKRIKWSKASAGAVTLTVELSDFPRRDD